MTRIQVISPMWPSAEATSFGVFVKNACDALEARGFEIDARAVINRPASGLRAKARAHLGLGLEIAKGALAEADCIYLHAPNWFGPLVQLAALPKNKPIIVHMHGDEVFPWSKVEWISQPAVARLARRADLIIAPSNYYAREVERAFFVPRGHLFVSPSGGVDTETFHPLDEQERLLARRELGIDERAEVIGYVGRIADDKGWDTFVDVVARLAVERPRLMGLVIGEGAELDAFLLRAKRTGAEPRIVRHGYRPQAELARAYAAMDVVLFPTRRKQEALGLVPIEAMASGTPVVGARISAVPEYVIEGESGLLADPFSAGDFATKTVSLLDAGEEARAALRQGARRIGERFDRETVAEALASVIEAVVLARR